MAGFKQLLPIAFFDAPAIRNALAAHDFRTVFIAIRDHTGLSQTDLGALVDLSQSRVSAVIRGERQLISATLIAKISQSFGIPARLLGFYSDSPGSLTSSSIAEVAEARPREVKNAHSVAWDYPDEEDDMKRRQLLVGGTAVGLTALTLPLPARVSLFDAQRLADRVEGYVTTEQTVGGGELAKAARDELKMAMQILETCDIESAAVSTFTSAVGNMAVTAGWLFYDANNQDEATAGYRDAMALANFVGDDELAAHTCLNSALQTIILARRGSAHPQVALRLTQRAADLTRRQPAGRVHALIAAREALSYACLGDRSGFERAIATAWREMDRAYAHEPIDRCPDWLKFMCHNEVRYHEASGAMHLGDSTRSAQLFEQVAAEHAAQRNAATYRAWFATSLAALGDVDTAVKEADDVLARIATAKISSSRTLRVLEPVRAAASKPHHLEFQQRYDRLSSLV
ncbi:helix-turn-helix domain-containing protein [Nocardia tenerifensis]|uniref:helix-turn-helix domain-containing protein n=1 Tax=Nocardia tenerifensis TaxID=228006 RepID=UPI0005954667|nr:helix-turn-helix transcriptional regulator [Nocardia tenerifensis]